MWEDTPGRWNAGAGSHRSLTRIQVWASGVQISGNAPIMGGTVTDELFSGIRRHIDLTITSAWVPWFTKYKRLEVRPFRGFTWGKYEYLCPMGRFPVTLDSLSRPAAELQLQAADYFEWIVNDNFTSDTPTWNSSRKLVCQRLIRDTGLGQPDVDDWSTTTGTPQGVWEKTRAETLTELVETAGGTVYFDRLGKPVIRDDEAGPTRELLTDGKTGTIHRVTRSYERQGVYNLVSAYSSNPDVQFAPAIVEITNPEHRAHKRWIGRRVYRLASPLFQNQAQAFVGANSTLNRVSRTAETYQVEVAPDARRDAGDTFPLSVTLAGTRINKVVTATRIVTPLRSGSGQYQVLDLATV